MAERSPDLRAVVELATLAPSIHNTQPWRFVLRERALVVRLDADRTLDVADPSRRQAVISCGAAAEFARLGVEAAGFGCSVVIPADGGDADALARLDVGDAAEPSAETRALVAAIRQRHTDRSVFEDRPLPRELVEELQRGVEAHGAWLYELSGRPTDLLAQALLARADAAERDDPAYRAELRSWLRPDPSAPDGVPAAAVPDVPPELRGSDWLLRDFTAEERRAGGGGAPPPPERPFVALLGTDTDGREAWVRAGMALAWLLLRATVEGVGASPMTQVLDQPSSRARLGQELGLVSHPQMLLRLGYGHGGVASGRRPVDEVVTEP